MELEKQVCSLELARRLKELGVKQESMFAWAEFPDRSWRVVFDDETKGYDAPAFTVAELGEILPRSTLFYRFGESDQDSYRGWECRNYPMFSAAPKLPEELYRTSTFFQAKTEADARAKMLVYLLENKLIKIERKEA